MKLKVLLSVTFKMLLYLPTMNKAIRKRKKIALSIFFRVSVRSYENEMSFHSRLASIINDLCVNLSMYYSCYQCSIIYLPLSINATNDVLDTKSVGSTRYIFTSSFKNAVFQKEKRKSRDIFLIFLFAKLVKVKKEMSHVKL